MTLTEFLLARIAEDEAGQVERYEIYDGHRRPFRTRVEHTPPSARALAECKAKRRIVAEHALSGHSVRAWVHCSTCGARVGPACRTLLALALPYADHPDFRDEWKP